MVYHCLRRPGARPFPGENGRVDWESWLIQDVCKYVKKVVGLVAPTKQVYIGVDGVVPMAKMRQQRLRRFKSHWIAGEEVRIGKRSGTEERWDTNAITPGTAFMERLGHALNGLASEGLSWKVSTDQEPGEGEHKAMRGLRDAADRDCHVIYGLDADLIVLALLQDVKDLYLFREAVECGEVQYNALDEEEYRYFHVTKLREVLTRSQNSEYLLDYCMAMCFVGNDFLPHGMTLKLKDGGHDILLDMVRTVRGQIGSFIDRKTMTWRREAVLGCLEWLADREEAAMVRHVSKKVGQRWQQPRGTTPVELAVDEWNKTPLRECDELALTLAVVRGEDHKTRCQLHPKWREIYCERYLHAIRKSELDTICTQYLVGLDWVLQYYLGKPVDTEWCFPWFMTPLWADLLDFARRTPVLPRTGPVKPFVQPQEQLALVLPQESWWLIRDRRLRELPKKAPQFWPREFQVFTAGHTQLWECEAQIPLFMPERLRWLLAH